MSHSFPIYLIHHFRKTCITIMILVFLSAVPGMAQGHREVKENDPSIEKVFDAIEKGLQKAEPAEFAQYIAGQTYISLSTGYTGYYSSNQAFYILQNYFTVHQPVSFRFTSRNQGKNPYATGVYHYETRNRRESAQVFISLRLQHNFWQISQITIR